MGSVARAQVKIPVDWAAQPDPTETRKHCVDVQRQPLRLNKNFLNFPLARDPRRHVAWERSEPKGKYWQAPLPGDDRIWLRFPNDTPRRERRCPDGVDMALLFAVLAEVQAQGGMHTSKSGGLTVKRVEFSSLVELATWLGLDPVNRNRNKKRLRRALALWEKLTLFHDCWYRAGREGRTQTRKVLPPPIKVGRRGRRFVIEVNQIWREIARARRYWKEVPLPLPTRDASQNLVLTMMAWARDEYPDGAGTPQKLDQRWVTRKIGLDSSRKNRTLRSAIRDAAEWFAENGGELAEIRRLGPSDNVVPVGKLAVLIKGVAVPRRRGVGTRAARGSERGPQNSRK